MCRPFPYESMMWQERQNAVLFERSISFSMPIASANTGRKNSTPNARIFPVRVAVAAGRATRAPTSAALNKTRITIAIVGIDPTRFRGFSLLQAAKERDEILNLFWLQAFAVSRHLPLAVADDSREFVVSLLLDVRGTQIPHLVCFSHRGFAFPVGAVTSHAFRLVQCFPAALRLRGSAQKGDSNHGNTSGH